MIKGISKSSFITTISSPKKENNNIQNVEKSKVDLIKEALKNGSYKLKLQQTSSQIAKTLL